MLFELVDGVRVTGIRNGNPIAGEGFAGNFYEVTVGANWRPNDNVVVRPEVRLDWYEGEDGTPGGLIGPFDDGFEKSDMFTAAVDLIFEF